MWKIQSFLSTGTCAVTLWQDYCEKGNVRRFFWNTVGKILHWECLFVNRAKGLFLSVHVDDIKMAGKTENMKPTWKILMKDVDLEEPTSFLDHIFWGCTQRECTISNDILTNQGFLVVPEKNYRPEVQGSLMQKSYLLRPTTWKVMQRNVWKDISNLRIKQLNNHTKSQHHAWMTNN